MKLRDVLKDLDDLEAQATGKEQKAVHKAAENVRRDLKR